MDIQLSDHFTYRKLLRFTLPSIGVMVVLSIYWVVDGFFVSNFAGKIPFAAVNFVMPFLMILGSAGLMFGTGGSALIGKTLGEGDSEKANRLFSMIIYFSIAFGILITIPGELFLERAAVWFGAEGEMLEGCVTYGRILLMTITPFILTFEFQSLMVTAEKPDLGFKVTLATGCLNILLDAVLVAGLRLGLTGAAVATAISQTIGALIPLLYFARDNSSLLRLTGMSWDGRAMAKACTNGLSELVNNIAFSIVGILYNVQFLKYTGEDGIAAYGVLLYVSMIFEAVYIGFCMGSSPAVSFHYGADDREELRSLLRKSLCIIGAASLCMMVFSQLMAVPLSYIYTGYDKDLMAMTVHGFRIYSITFLFSGFGIYGSSFFTALNNGPVSALISILRTMVFEVLCVLALPLLFGPDGIWASVVAADFMAMTVSFILLRLKQKQYGY